MDTLSTSSIFIGNILYLKCYHYSSIKIVVKKSILKNFITSIKGRKTKNKKFQKTNKPKKKTFFLSCHV